MAVHVAVEPRSNAGNGRVQDLCPAAQRALTMWPRLDRRELSRRGCDKARLAKYVSRRTRLPLSSIEAILERS